MRHVGILLTLGILAGCAATLSETGTAASGTPAAPAEQPAPAPQGPEGILSVDITNVLGKQLPARIDLLDVDGYAPVRLEAPGGKLETRVRAAAYRAYTQVYDQDVLVLADIQDITVRKDQTTHLLVNLLEGSSGSLSLRDFDSDVDFALDRAELASGTDPQNPVDIPGRKRLPYDPGPLRAEAGWYRGELRAHSRYGEGTESVGRLIHRANRAGLDFLAITDRNTLGSVYDPEYHSKEVVLIPAMEWGVPEKGYALIYGPRTELETPAATPAGLAAAQTECIRLQSQGGIFIIAHPCMPTQPWQWELGYANGVEVWQREWSHMPPLLLEQLGDDMKFRKDGKLTYPVAQAAARSELAQVSANAQAAFFWDLELQHGLMACAVGSSNSASPKVPLGKPVTYVFAREKSVPGILEGLRLGRTFVTRDIHGPIIHFSADVLGDGKIDVGVGGIIPLGVDTKFLAAVKNAKGKKLQVLENGHPIRTVPIVKDSVMVQFTRHPAHYAAYRVRVISPPTKTGLGDVDVCAMTSPIYAQEITQDLLWRNPKLDVDKAWVKVETPAAPEVILPEDVAPALTAP